MTALTFEQTGTGAVVVHVGEPDGVGPLGLLTWPEAVRTADALLRAAVGAEVRTALVAALRVGLDGADPESTGLDAAVINEAWRVLELIDAPAGVPS